MNVLLERKLGLVAQVRAEMLCRTLNGQGQSSVRLRIILAHRLSEIGTNKFTLWRFLCGFFWIEVKRHLLSATKGWWRSWPARRQTFLVGAGANCLYFIPGHSRQ